MTKQSKWDRHTILAELRRRHMTLLGLAEQEGLSQSSVKNIWSRPNEKAERAIAAFIGEAVEIVFPDRYPKVRNRILRPSYPANTQQNKSAQKAA